MSVAMAQFDLHSREFMYRNKGIQRCYSSSCLGFVFNRNQFLSEIIWKYSSKPIKGVTTANDVIGSQTHQPRARPSRQLVVDRKRISVNGYFIPVRSSNPLARLSGCHRVALFYCGARHFRGTWPPSILFLPHSLLSAWRGRQPKWDRPCPVQKKTESPAPSMKETQTKKIGDLRQHVVIPHSIVWRFDGNGGSSQ